MRALGALLLVLAALVAGCGGDDDAGEGATEGFTATAAESAPATEPADTSGDEEASGCESAEAPEPRPSGTGKAPTTLLNEDKAYDVLVKTNCGEFTIRLDPKASPKTAASFAALVEAKFFDGTVFHRIVPGFVIQGGDPTATGTGGPGYSTRDVPPQDAAYTEGTVAMAKTGAEPPGTAGSQFYIVTAPDAGLPPEYALLGKVVEGQDVVEAIGELGDPASGDAGTPLQPVVIERATVRES